MTKDELCKGLWTIIHHVNELSDKVPTMTDAEYAAYQAYMREVDAICEGFKPLIERCRKSPTMMPFTARLESSQPKL